MTPSNKNNSTVSVMHKKRDDLNLCKLLLSKYFNKKKKKSGKKLSAQVEYIKEFSKIWICSPKMLVLQNQNQMHLLKTTSTV